MSEQTTDPTETAEERATNRIAWFLVGTAVGLTAAMLYAPTSGKQTREYISSKTQEGREALEDTTQDLVDRGREVYEQGRQLVDDVAQLFERGRKLARG